MLKSKRLANAFYVHVIPLFSRIPHPPLGEEYSGFRVEQVQIYKTFWRVPNFLFLFFRKNVWGCMFFFHCFLLFLRTEWRKRKQIDGIFGCWQGVCWYWRRSVFSVLSKLCEKWNALWTMHYELIIRLGRAQERRGERGLPAPLLASCSKDHQGFAIRANKEERVWQIICCL